STSGCGGMPRRYPLRLWPLSIPGPPVRRPDAGGMRPSRERPEGDYMRFALLIYDENTASPSPEPPDPATMANVMEAYNAYTQALRDAGAYAGGEALQPNPTATTVRVRDGQSGLTDGPFAETKEGLGGFYLLDLPG